jgi:hypothetical protein
MAIGNTKIDEQIRRYHLLSEAVAWIDTFDSVTKKQIIDWIQQDQLIDEGINKFGKIIGCYSYATELISNGKKKQGDHYNLFDTGAFFRSFVVIVGIDAIKIDANAQKGEDNLFKKFGNKIIGLTDENFKKLKELVKKSYISYARKVLQID